MKPILVPLFLLLLSHSSFASSAINLEGKWSGCKANSRNGSSKLTYEFSPTHVKISQEEFMNKTCGDSPYIAFHTESDYELVSPTNSIAEAANFELNIQHKAGPSEVVLSASQAEVWNQRSLFGRSDWKAGSQMANINPAPYDKDSFIELDHMEIHIEKGERRLFLSRRSSGQKGTEYINELKSIRPANIDDTYFLLQK